MYFNKLNLQTINQLDYNPLIRKNIAYKELEYILEKLARACETYQIDITLNENLLSSRSSLIKLLDSLFERGLRMELSLLVNYLYIDYINDERHKEAVEIILNNLAEASKKHDNHILFTQVFAYVCAKSQSDDKESHKESFAQFLEKLELAVNQSNQNSLKIYEAVPDFKEVVHKAYDNSVLDGEKLHLSKDLSGYEAKYVLNIIQDLTNEKRFYFL